MRKSIQNLGKILSKTEQQNVNGSFRNEAALCTHCGYLTPNERTCYRFDGSSYVESCIPR